MVSKEHTWETIPEHVRKCLVLDLLYYQETLFEIYNEVLETRRLVYDVMTHAEFNTYWDLSKTIKSLALWRSK